MSPGATILRCDIGGVILEIVADGLGMADFFTIGRQIDHLVADTDSTLAGDLIAAIRRDGAVFDRLLAVDRRGGRGSLRFEGSKIDGQLLITVRALARAGFASSHETLDAMVALNNRLVNRQRALARALSDATHREDAAHTISPIAGDRARIALADRFSDREREVLPLLLKGLPNREMARLLAIEVSAVKARLRTIFRKLGVSSRAQALIVLAHAPLSHKEKFLDGI